MNLNLREHVKEIEKKYQAGQNLFRRNSVGFLLERISQLEQSAQQSAQWTCVVCGGKLVIYDRQLICSNCGEVAKRSVP